MADNKAYSGDPEIIRGSGDVRSLVVRAWREAGMPPDLRVRIVEIVPGLGERPMLVTTSVDEACRVVRNWLEAVRPPGAKGSGDGAVTRG